MREREKETVEILVDGELGEEKLQSEYIVGKKSLFSIKKRKIAIPLLRVFTK